MRQGTREQHSLFLPHPHAPPLTQVASMWVASATICQGWPVSEATRSLWTQVSWGKGAPRGLQDLVEAEQLRTKPQMRL